MIEWAFSVRAKVEGVSEEEALAVLERLAVGEAAPTVSFSFKGDRLGATFTVKAYTMLGAITAGINRFGEALGPIAGRPYEILEGEATTYEELEARLAPASDLVGVTEIAKMIGRSRQRAGQLTGTPGWPEPAARLASGPVWRRHEVEAALAHLKSPTGRPSVPQTA